MNISNIKQAGFSIIEIMVASMIGLMMLLGVVQIFVSSKNSFRFNNELSEIQENARFINLQMTRQLQVAGFRSLPNAAEQQPFDDFSNIFTTNSEYIDGTSGSGINGSDTLTVRYQGSGTGLGTPDNTIIDCTNNAIDSGVISTNVFSINNNFELVCNNMVLIGGVEHMKILYGEDLTADRNPNRYVPIDFATLDKNNIVSVRISVLLRTTNQVRETVDTGTYNLLGTEFNPVDDKHLRRVFTTTIKLRNIAQSGM